MTSVTMTAGSLTVSVSTDADGDAPGEDCLTAEEAAELCQRLQRWQMNQWSRLDGECVRTVPESYNLFG